MTAIRSFLSLLGLAACLLALPGQVVGQTNYGHWTGVKLQWIAPGDDGNVGTAFQYDVRYSTSSISESNWAYASHCGDVPRPLIAGSGQRCYVTGLAAGTKYYFAIKTVDEVSNWSRLSKVSGFTAKSYSYPCGDVNGDGVVNLADLTVLIDFVYLDGEQPLPLKAGNVDGDASGRMNLTDITTLIAYIYLHTANPVCE